MAAAEFHFGNRPIRITKGNVCLVAAGAQKKSETHWASRREEETFYAFFGSSKEPWLDAAPTEAATGIACGFGVSVRGTASAF